MRYSFIVCLLFALCFNLTVVADENEFIKSDEDHNILHKKSIIPSPIANKLPEKSTRKLTEKSKNVLIPAKQMVPFVNKTDKGSAIIKNEGNMPSSMNVISIVGFMVFICALALYLKFKKSGKLNRKYNVTERQLSVISEIKLPHGSLSLVALADKIYLIGSNDHAISCLDTIEDSVEKDRILNNSPMPEEKQQKFHSEYNDMIDQMNQGFPEDKQVTTQEVSSEMFGDELGNLKQRLKELA